MNPRRRKLITLIVVSALLLLGAAAAVRFTRADPQLVKVKTMGSELAQESARNFQSALSQETPASLLTPSEEQRQRWEQFRRETEKLSPDQRREVSQELFKVFEKQVDFFLALPKAQQDFVLDLFIDQMERARKDWGNRAGRNSTRAGQAVSSAPSGTGTAAGTSSGSSENASASGAAAGAGSSSGPSENASAPDAKRKARSPEEWERRRKEFLDFTTPQERAKLNEAMRRFEDRRRERGLPPLPMRGGR